MLIYCHTRSTIWYQVLCPQVPAEVQYFNETEGARVYSTGEEILTQSLIQEHCTTLAVGVDTEWVEQVHRKAHRRKQAL